MHVIEKAPDECKDMPKKRARATTQRLLQHPISHLSPQSRPTFPPARHSQSFFSPTTRDWHLLDISLALKVLALDQVGNVVLVVVGARLVAQLAALAPAALLQALVALGQLAQRRERVGTQLVQDARDELGELLVLAVAVDGKGVGGDRGVD